MSSHLSKHRQLVASSARTLHASASRFTPQPTTARQLTLTLVLPPPHQPLPPPSGPGRHATPLPSSPATAGPRYPLLLSAAPPYLTRPLPLVHHSFHFLLLALLNYIPLPSRATWLSYPLQFYPLAAHQTLQSETGALLRPSLPSIATAHLTAPLSCVAVAARPASACERVLPSLSLRCHHVRHVRRPSAPLHAATTAASCRS